MSDINPRNQLLVLEVRREIERLLSVQVPSALQRRERAAPGNRASYGSRPPANDDIAFMRLDRDLNQLMIEAAHNDYAARCDETAAGPVAALLVHALPRGRRSAAVRAAARQSGARDRKGEPTRAAKASDHLLDYIASFTRATVNV